MAEDYLQQAAEIYDVSTPDWPGEFDFYHALAEEAGGQAGKVLEVACGTGRIVVRLAALGYPVSGVDLSPYMLEVARQKAGGLANIHLVEGDMRTFDLGERYALAIIPGHSFQHMLTAADQLTCLLNIRRHLLPGGRLVVHLDHQDLDWLGALPAEAGVSFESAERVIHPRTGQTVQAARSWAYQRSTQTASVITEWYISDESGGLVDHWERGPIKLHCVFRCEMEHLLARAGFTIEALYGDFLGGSITDQSSEMVWVARRSES